MLPSLWITCLVGMQQYVKGYRYRMYEEVHNHPEYDAKEQNRIGFLITFYRG